MEPGELIQRWQALSEAIETARQERFQVEQALRDYLYENGASVLEVPEGKVELQRTPSKWDYGVLSALRERPEIPEPVLAKAFTPEHEETITVPQKWDMRRVLPLARYGREVADIIARAEIPGELRLKVTPKEEEVPHA